MYRPTIGYKAVIRFGGFQWMLCELEIPDSANLVHSGGGFYRADMAVPLRFLSSSANVTMNDTSAHSWFDKEFVYIPGHTALANLDDNPNTDCAAGIHFFETMEQAVNWGNANFGLNASA